MAPSGDADILLFSYGSLRQEEVQLAKFGRRLEGRPDAAVGYRLESIAIDNPEVVSLSGSAVHRIIVSTGDPSDMVEGTVFKIGARELAAADDYEVSAYRRVEVPLGSGARAWAYVAAG